MTRHLVHSTFGTFGITVVRNILFILPMVFLSDRLSGLFIYTRARVYLCSREILHREREKPLPGVSARRGGVGGCCCCRRRCGGGGTEVATDTTCHRHGDVTGSSASVAIT